MQHVDIGTLDHAVALVDVQRLPPKLRLLCKLLGVRKALELCQKRGGVPLSLPKVASADHYLVPVIGLDGLEALIAHHGGEVIDVPKYDKVAIQIRHLVVQGLLQSGLGLTRAALMAGYTKRQVQNIKNDLAGAETVAASQPDLFGDNQGDLVGRVEAAAECEPTGERPILAIDADHREVAQLGCSAHNPFGI